MEKLDRELLSALASTDPSLHKLFIKHQKLAKEVENYERYARYSHSAALRAKELKKAKLREKDTLMLFLREHRASREGDSLAELSH